MSAPELLPCPFCGGGNIREHGDDKVVGYHCRTCEASGPNHYVTGMEWNTRAAPGWQDISTAPTDGTEIDIWIPSIGRVTGAVRPWAYNNPTHWMLPPTPPVQS